VSSIKGWGGVILVCNGYVKGSGDRGGRVLRAFVNHTKENTYCGAANGLGWWWWWWWWGGGRDLIF